MFNYDRFISLVNHSFIKLNEDLRYGQYIMIALDKQFPEIAQSVPEEINPFYDNNKIPMLLGFLADTNN